MIVNAINSFLPEALGSLADEGEDGGDQPCIIDIYVLGGCAVKTTGCLNDLVLSRCWIKTWRNIAVTTSYCYRLSVCLVVLLVPVLLLSNIVPGSRPPSLPQQIIIKQIIKLCHNYG